LIAAIVQDALQDAAARAVMQLVAVRDDPMARLALAASTYYGPTGRAPRHLPFRRAAMSFMHGDAHALVAAPRLALGRLAGLARMIGDPRLGMAGVFLSMGRVLPHRYPLSDNVKVYLRDEHSLGRVLDYAVIGPRLQALYDWSAAELGQPELRGLITDGRPGYVWAHTERHVWDAPPLPLLGTMLGRVTAPRYPTSPPCEDALDAPETSR
jgi:hypothetical protein